MTFSISSRLSPLDLMLTYESRDDTRADMETVISILKISISSDIQFNHLFYLIIIVQNNLSIRKFKFSAWRIVTLQGIYFEFILYIKSWNALGTSYYKWSPSLHINIHNLYDMNKFLCIYQSPYYLSVDNAFSVLYIQNVYIYSKYIRPLVITSYNAPVVY
jgi:hypothetical protein